MDLHDELEKSIENCCWKSVKFISNAILERDVNNRRALFGKALQYFARSRFVELEDWMKILPRDILTDRNLLILRCQALKKQKRYWDMLFLLGGDTDHIVKPPLVSLEEIKTNPVLERLRECALFNLSRIDFRGKVIKRRTECDPLSSASVSHDISRALMDNNAELLAKYTNMCDTTSSHDALLLVACGCYRWLRHRSETGITFLSKAVEEDPDLEIAWVAFIAVLSMSGDVDLALSVVKKSQRRFPNSTELLFLAVSIYLKSRSLDIASMLLKRIDPNDPMALHESGVICLLNGEVAEGARRFMQVLDMKTERILKGSALFNWGHCLRILRKFDEAIEKYFAALMCNVDAAEVLASVAFTYHLIGDLDQAIRYYNSCLSISRTHPFASHMLQLLMP